MNTQSISRIAVNVFAAIVAFASLSTASQAQNPGEAIQVNIPFAFEIMTKQLPAGLYTVQMEQQRVVSLRGAVTSSFALSSPATNHNLTTTNHGKLIFHKQGNRYFLREVWLPGREFHSDVTRSKDEKDFERAGNGNNSAYVELAGLAGSR